MTRDEYESEIARVLRERHGYSPLSALEEAMTTLSDFLRSEQIQFGDPGYDWTDPTDFVNEAIAPYLESAP